MSLASLLERISIREGSSSGANMRLIRRLQAGASGMKRQGDDQYSL